MYNLNCLLLGANRDNAAAAAAAEVDRDFNDYLIWPPNFIVKETEAQKDYLIFIFYLPCDKGQSQD